MAEDQEWGKIKASDLMSGVFLLWIPDLMGENF